jgi:lipoic acid synthetase
MRSGQRKPQWLKKKLPPGAEVNRVERLVKRHGLNTVCHGAKCPNRNDCYHQGTATFMILGHTCTRTCRFCSIPDEKPLAPDRGEPARLAEAVKEMGLAYVVVTSVTRDDLEDGGAAHFAAVIGALKKEVPGIGVEVLVPDFGGSEAALGTVMDAGPSVLNHNIETVPSLYEKVRPQADYRRSLELLERASRYEGIPAKSGLMVGLGEGPEEVAGTLEDLKAAGVELLTIGQYLQPGPQCLEVVQYVEPGRFDRYAELAGELGFLAVASGPFVRSSHRAGSLYEQYLSKVRRT